MELIRVKYYLLGLHYASGVFIKGHGRSSEVLWAKDPLLPL